MDPVIVKFVQLIGAELLGAGLCVAGVVMFFRGIGGVVWQLIGVCLTLCGDRPI
jgi:hypothetical protein